MSGDAVIYAWSVGAASFVMMMLFLGLAMRFGPRLTQQKER